MGAGEGIGMFFFDNADCGKMLVWSAWIMVPIGLTNITSSILNSLGYEVKSMKNYIIGGVVMLVCIWVLPAYIGIYSVVVGMGLCMVISTVLNIRMINKITTSRSRVAKSTFLMAICCVPVASLVSFSTNLLSHFMPLFFNLAISCSLGLAAFLALCQVFDLIDIRLWFINFKQKFKKKIA